MSEELKVATSEMIRETRKKFRLESATPARVAAMVRSAGYLRPDGRPYTPDDIRAVLDREKSGGS